MASINPDCSSEKRYPFSIRQATLEDVEILVKLRMALIRETDPCEEEPSAAVEAANREYLEKRIPNADFVGWIAENDGEVVGTIGLVFFARPPHAANLTGVEAYLMNMYTRPEFRGMGVATALMEEALDFIKQSDARRVWLHATEAARKIYATLGFSPNHTELEINF